MSTDPEAILSGLTSTEAEERRQALGHVGRLPMRDAVPLLVRALGDESWRVRKEASAIAQTFASEPLLIQALLALLGVAQDVGLRNAVVEVLAASGRAATTEVARQMAALDADGRKLAVEILGRGGDPAAFAALEQRLRDEDANVRQAAVEMLITLGKQTHPGTPLRAVLIRSLRDADALVRMTALDGLTALGVELAWEQLEPLLSHPTLRAAGLRAAAYCPDPAALEVLVQAMARGRSSESLAALAALGPMAAGARLNEVGARVRAEGAPLVRRILGVARGDGGEPLNLRAAALLIAAAGRFPGTASLAIDALSDPDRVEHALRALEVLGMDAMRPLIEAIREPEVDQGGADALAALVELTVEMARAPDACDAHARDELVSRLRRCTRSRHPALATASISALAELGTPADLAPMTELVTSRSDRAAEHALRALATRFPAAARELLTEQPDVDPPSLATTLLLGALARREPMPPKGLELALRAATSGDERTRRAAFDALAEHDDREVVSALEAALGDEALTVRLAAARALGRASLRSGPSRPRCDDRLELVRRTGDPTLVAALVRSMGEGLSTLTDARIEAEHLDSLRPMVRADSSVIALAAVDALGRAPNTPARRSALLEALDHADPAVVQAALLKLGADPTALIRCEAHPSPDVRLLVGELSEGIDDA